MCMWHHLPLVVLCGIWCRRTELDPQHRINCLYRITCLSVNLIFVSKPYENCQSLCRIFARKSIIMLHSIIVLHMEVNNSTSVCNLFQYTIMLASLAFSQINFLKTIENGHQGVGPPVTVSPVFSVVLMDYFLSIAFFIFTGIKFTIL